MCVRGASNSQLWPSLSLLKSSRAKASISATLALQNGKSSQLDCASAIAGFRRDIGRSRPLTDATRLAAAAAHRCAPLDSSEAATPAAATRAPANPKRQPSNHVPPALVRRDSHAPLRRATGESVV